MTKLSDIANPHAQKVALLGGGVVVIEPVSLLTMMEIEEEHGISVDQWVKNLMQATTLRDKMSALWLLVANKPDFETKEIFFKALSIGDIKKLEEAMVRMATRSMPAATAAPGGGSEGNGPSPTGPTTSRRSRARTATRSKKSSR